MNNSIDVSVAKMVGASVLACPRTRGARVPTGLRSWMIAFVAAFLAVTSFAGYPGNPNFYDKPFINKGATRTDWVTNITHFITESTNPGYVAPIDWEKYSKPIAPGVDHIPAVFTTEGGWPTNMVCHMVRIDLTTPNIRFTGTDRCPEGWGENMPEPQAKKSDGSYYKKRTVREKTSDFLYRNRGAKSLGGKGRDARIAFNLAAWLPWTSPTTNLWAEPYAPLYSDGVSVSFKDTGGVANAKGEVVPQSMIVIYKDGTAELINSITTEKAKKIWFCAPAFVSEIVSAGVVPGHATAIDPRTAMGISQDQKKLYLFFCDGRRAGWSGGCYWSSLSTLLQAMGSWYAINLDGGGSSTFCVWNETEGKPMVFNRPTETNLRYNGSNAAIYYKAPDAMIGTWIYDDMDFLVQDIIDGETPDGIGEINVLGDATFTAEHPYIPSGRWTIVSTNNASIGWADGVAPQVAAGTIVRFRNIRFREGSRSLTVGTGATTVFYEGVDIDEVSFQNVGGLVIDGTPACPVRVSCAAATGVGQVFATSSALSLANARVAAKKFVCAADERLVAEAFEEWGTVKFKWCRPILLGDVTAKIAPTLDRGIVTVPVTECAVDYVSGYRLKLTVTSEDERRTATQYLAVEGVGEYTFDTTGASDPAICASGYNFGYTVELVDSDGVHVANIPTISGQMSVGVDKSWFAASAADDSAVGGSWSDKPEIVNGAYKIAEGSAADFGASEQKTGRVRFEMDAVFKGYFTELQASAALDQFAQYGTPHGACFLAKANFDGDLAWRGLVKEGGTPVFKLLYGPAATNTPCKVITEVEWSSGVPYVRYSVAFNGVETVLADANGESWFPGASSESSAKGRVVVSGTGSINLLVGRYLSRILAGGYSAWMAEAGLTGDPADKTGGIENGIRYAFNIDPSATTVGDPIIKVVFDANGHPSVQSRELAEGRDDVTFDVLATEDLTDWRDATIIKMKQCDDGLWKPADPNYVFPDKMFYKYLIDVK